VSPTYEEPVPNPRLWAEKVTELTSFAGPAVIKFLSLVGQQRWGPLAENPAVFLRDSRSFRAGSLGYHVDLLRRQFHAYFVRAHERKARHDSRSLLYNAQRDITYLTDDVLFNAVSMLDYLGNLVGFVLTRDKSTLKWNGVVKAGRDKGNPLSAKSVVASMVRLDKEWVDAFFDVRSTIIHNKVLLGNGSQNVTFQIKDNRLVPTKLSFPMDQYVVRRLKFLSCRPGEQHVELVDGTEQIALASLDAAILVARELLQELGGPLQPAKTRTAT
jgi:hypothetical protein